MIDFTTSTTSTTSTPSSLSATSAFHGGGVGAGARGGVGAGVPRTDITAATATTVPVMDTAIAVGLEWLNYKAVSPAPAITMALSTESWDLRLGEQYGPTSATTDIQADLASSRWLVTIQRGKVAATLFLDPFSRRTLSQTWLASRRTD
jgi:hypothetical protein